jgi:ketose-bisphosphate aldolase
MLNAYRQGIVIPAMNVPYLPMIEPIIAALRDTDSFGLIEVARLEWEKFQSVSLEAVYRTYQSCRDDRHARLHLDHIPVIDEDGQRVDYEMILRRAIDIGYDSVMIDGSRLPLNENIDATLRVAELAHAADIPIEAELGAVIGHESGPAPSYDELFASKRGFTRIDEAVQFVHATGIDWLSIAFGNVHGAIAQARRSEAKIAARLDIDHLQQICDAVDLPLVLHGGSSIPASTIRDAIAHGIAKINIGAELRQAYEAGLKTSAFVAQNAVYKHACVLLRDSLNVAGRADALTQLAVTQEH